MIRTNVLLMFSSLVFLMACSKADEDPTVPAATAENSVRAESWRESQLLVGQEVYEAACASCHDQGDGGAPVTGDRDAWSGRSDLWTAVLSEHAQAGYLDMPEKGGHGEFSDKDISAAVEYMMLQTFPERLRD
jgi:cytochrome c5